MKHKVCHFKDATPVEFAEPHRTSYVQLTTKDGVSLGVGGCEVPPHSSNQNHVHDAPEVMHVIEGQLEFVFEDCTEVLGPRDVIYVPAGEWHQIFNRTDEPAYHTYVFGDPACTDLILNRYNQK